MEAEKNTSDRLKRLRILYDKHFEDLTKKIQEEIVAPNTDSASILFQDFLNDSGSRICKQVIQIGALHWTPRLNASALEECIQRLLEVLNNFLQMIVRAQFVAGDPLANIFFSPIANIIYGAQILLDRTLPSGDRDKFDEIQKLAREVFDAYKSFIDDPRNRAVLTLVSIFDVAQKSDESLPMTEMEEGSAVEDYDENDRSIKELTNDVIRATVSVIKDLPLIALAQNDVGLSRIIPIMEDITKMSKVMRDRVNEIRKYYCPLREDRILQTLNGTKDLIGVLEQRLRNYYKHRAKRCLLKIHGLNSSLNELEDELVNSLKQTKRGASSSSS